MITTIQITPTNNTTTTTTTTTTQTTRTMSSIISIQSLLRVLLFIFITLLTISSHHVIAEHTYPAIPSADQQETSSITHPPLPSSSTFNEQYNTSVAAPTPVHHTSPHSTNDIAWATVIYDSTSSTNTISVHDQTNQSHPYAHHVRNDELHGQYGASSNPVLLRETAAYEKQKAAKAAQKQKQHVDPEMAVLAEQYGVVTPKSKAEDKEIPDIHTLAEDEMNGKISLETKLIANGTLVLPNIIEKDAAKWTDSGYGSASADAIKAKSEADDTPLEQIFKDEETRAAAIAAVSEIVSLEAMELAELKSLKELERATLQSYEDAQHDAQRSTDTELLDEITRENAYVRRSKTIIDKQIAREQYLLEQTRASKLHELEELNHQHVIGNDHVSRSQAPQDEMHGQYGIIANPDVISAQAQELEKSKLPPVYAAPPADHGVEYGDKFVPTHAPYEFQQDTITTPHVDEDEKDTRPSQDTYGLANGSIPFATVNETTEAVLTDSEYGSSVETLSSGDNVVHVPPMERVTPTITSYEPRTNPDMKQWESQDMIVPQHNTISQAFPNIASQEEPVATPAPIQVDGITPDMIPTSVPQMDNIPIESTSNDDSHNMMPFSLKDIHTLAHEADMQASDDPFNNIPSFSLSQHLETLINNDEMEFAAMGGYTGGWHPTTPAPPTHQPTTPPPNHGTTPPPYHWWPPCYANIYAADIPAPSTISLSFNYSGLWPDTIITPDVNVSVIATTFRIKCVPSNTKGGTLGTITVDGLTSPIQITGLDGTVAYTCTAGAITPAYGLLWGKSWNQPIQTGQQRVTIRVLLPFNETCGTPKVSQFYSQFQAILVAVMHISSSELTIVSCLRDYMGMTLVTIAFTFPIQFQIQSKQRMHIMDADTTTTPTTLSASQKRDLLQNLISNPDSALYEGISYAQMIDNSYWSAEQRDLGRDVCGTSSACSSNDYCYNGYETTYQCQCDSTLSTRNCWNQAISCAAPACLSAHHISMNVKPLPDCAIFTIPIVLNLAAPLSSTESLEDQANDIIAMLAQSTSQDPSVFEFVKFLNNTDGTPRIELNVLQNGNRSTSCIVQDIQYQQQDIRTVLMRPMDTQMGGLSTVLKQCDDGQYDVTCDVAPAKPWYLFWIYVGVIILGCILSLLMLYFLALYACIHIFPEPMAAFMAKHRIPGVNEKKLAELQQRKAAKRKAEALANGIYDVKDMDIGDSCEESDFHSNASNDESFIQKIKNKAKGKITMINGGTYRPESARKHQEKTSAAQPSQANAKDTTKPKRFFTKDSTPSSLVVPVDSTGQVTDNPSPSHCMQVMDLSMPSDVAATTKQPTTQTTTVRSGFFGRKIITTRRASGFKMPEFSVIPLANGEKTPPELDESMDTRTYGASISQDSPSRVASASVSRMGPQSTAWTEPVSRVAAPSISHRSAHSVTDPRILSSSQPTNISQALAYAQTQLYDDIPTIDTTTLAAPVSSRFRSHTPPATTPRLPHGIRRRSSSIDNSIIGRVYYSSDSDHEAIQPSRNTVSHMVLPTRELSRNTPRSHIHIDSSRSTRSHQESLPNGYNSGMESPHETSDYEYSQRSEYSHL